MTARHTMHLMEKVTNFAIMFKDANGIIEECNVGAENILGWSKDEAVGQLIEMIYTPDDRANRISHLRGRSGRRKESGGIEDRGEGLSDR